MRRFFLNLPFKIKKIEVSTSKRNKSFYFHIKHTFPVGLYELYTREIDLSSPFGKNFARNKFFVFCGFSAHLPPVFQPFCFLPAVLFWVGQNKVAAFSFFEINLLNNLIECASADPFFKNSNYIVRSVFAVLRKLPKGHTVEVLVHNGVQLLPHRQRLAFCGAFAGGSTVIKTSNRRQCLFGHS